MWLGHLPGSTKWSFQGGGRCITRIQDGENGITVSALEEWATVGKKCLFRELCLPLKTEFLSFFFLTSLSPTQATDSTGIPRLTISSLVTVWNYNGLPQSYLRPSFGVLTAAPPPHDHVITFWVLGIYGHLQCTMVIWLWQCVFFTGNQHLTTATISSLATGGKGGKAMCSRDGLLNDGYSLQPQFQTQL